MKKLKLLLVYLLLQCAVLTRAQTYINTPMTGTPAPGQYYNNISIQVNPNFSFTAAAGQSLKLFISDADCIPLVNSFSANQNYILTVTPRIPGITNQSGFANRTACDLMQTVQYIDGLGRPLQTVQVMGSPTNRDIVQPIAYDQFGREAVKYLPYALTGAAPNNGSYKATAIADQSTFYTTPPAGVSTIPDPSAQTGFEPSPLNRVVEQGAPGVAWQLSTNGISGSGHTMKSGYTVNNSTTWAADSVNSMQVALYNVTVNANQSRTLVAAGNYAAGQLLVTVSKDENWVSGRAGTTEEYKDKDGHVVLKRTYNYTTSLQRLSTYYVYDDFGDLAFVLPPAANGDAATTISQATLDNLCYQYRYDEKGRPSQKKIPGKGWEYTIYNVTDRPVATQDSLQRAAKNWITTKYDAFGRDILTGIWNNGGTAISRSSLQATVKALTTNLYEKPVNSGNGYTNAAWPTSNVTATLTTDFYDTYANIPGLPATYTLTSGVSQMTTGLPTVKKTAVLNTPADQLWEVSYYDDLARPTITYAQHYLGGTINTGNYDVTATTYNFSNQPTTTTRQHWNTASATVPLVTIANTYLYDHSGRKTKTWEQITNGNNAPTANTLISKIDYNEIGQVLNKHLHSTDSVSFLQNIAYTYNERGWLTVSTAPLFAMSLFYNTGTLKAYNGNIRYQYWGTPGNEPYYYVYTYDKLNRLTTTISQAGNDESGINYDLMGNITALQRHKASTLIDNLGYTYTSSGNPTNQVRSVADASGNNAGLVNGTTTYTWDGNGNLLSNANTVNTAQNKSFTYNLLNLPQSVTIPNGTVTYTYDATGNKLRKVSVISGVTKTTDYISGIEYDGAATDTLNFIQTEEGKAAKYGNSYDYNYYLGDNLGNTRITFGTKTGAAVSYQKDDYYPFGMEINMPPLPTPKNEYLYNRKELQEETGEYDFNRRFYDPLRAQWNMVDPLAEQSRRWSPYNYVENNPIRFIDPDGMYYEESTAAASIAADEARWASNAASAELGKSSSNFNGGFASEAEPEQNGDKGDKKTIGSQTVSASYLNNKWHDIVVDNGSDDPATLSSYQRTGDAIEYGDGSVQNYKNGSQNAAVFTDKNGNLIVLPGVQVSDRFVVDGAGATPGNGTIYLSTARDPNGKFINRLIDLEHEYGHFLDAYNRGSFTFAITTDIPSTISAKRNSTEVHLSQPYELRATRLAIKFFGPDSEIAKKSLYTKHLNDK